MELEKKYYYSDEATGACAQDFAEIDGESYYFNDSCEMVKGWITIDKNRYHFADDGKMTKGWYEEPPEKYYFKGDGSAGKGLPRSRTSIITLIRKIASSPAGTR
jgi:glucan-binding YG repeat protein